MENLLEELRDYFQFLLSNGYKNIRFVNNNAEWVATCSFIFTTAIVKGHTGDRSTIDNRWCYHAEEDAKAALDAWDGVTGEPKGWHRHPMSGRRREGGDASKEYVRF